MSVVKEHKIGLLSVFTMKCSICNMSEKIYTSEGGQTSRALDINISAVSAIIGIGSTFNQLEEICTSLTIPCMKPQTFQRLQSDVSIEISKNAFEKMQDAVEEEKRLAIEEGNVGPDGVPEITVVCDGTWAKRSYRTNYNSLSGAAAIIEIRTRKVLF